MLLREPLPGRVAGMRIVEDYRKKPGVLGAVRGVFSQCDITNRNGRVYERALWEQVLKEDKYRQAIVDKTLLGEPDHPETRTQSAIREGSHTVVEATLDDKGDLRGVVEVFDNPLGRMVWPMLQAGVKLGFSTRGDGDLIEDARAGNTRVDPGTYEWHGVDFVLNPSFVGAVPESVTEEVRKKVRSALLEAVEGKKIQEGVKEDVEALLESTVTEEGEVYDLAARIQSIPGPDAPRNVQEVNSVAWNRLEQGDQLKVTQLDVRPVEQGSLEAAKKAQNTQALEQALSQLRDAKEKIVELQEQVKKQSALASGFEDGVAEWQQENALLKMKLKEARGKFVKVSEKIKALTQKLEEAEDTTEVDELKQILEENQRSHLELVEKHRKALGEKDELEKRCGKSREVIEGLRDRVGDAEKRVTEAEQALTEQRGRVPAKVKSATLEQYKKLKSEGVEVPSEVRPLLERAQTEGEVDALIETLQSSQASRYDYLPLDLNSRRRREEILEALDEQQKKEDEKKTADPDREETEKVIESQLRR